LPPARGEGGTTNQEKVRKTEKGLTGKFQTRGQQRRRDRH